MVDAYSCMNPGKDLTPKQWGDKVRAVSTGSRSPVSVWHGTADYTVAPMNMRELSEQRTDVGVCAAGELAAKWRLGEDGVQ
ncbi:hypothetical protein [Amycolatopsis sp. cmx-11-51]|uniref:hypothetical protein n=1 Tax=unclassified Amycolatopsis TaxID=2618356 RepID=UPI0039E43813